MSFSRYCFAAAIDFLYVILIIIRFFSCYLFFECYVCYVLYLWGGSTPMLYLSLSCLQSLRLCHCSHKTSNSSAASLYYSVPRCLYVYAAACPTVCLCVLLSLCLISYCPSLSVCSLTVSLSMSVLLLSLSLFS
jgi:hypothetical protein